MEAAKMGFQMQLIPPFRYAIVEESFYRGAYPTLKNFRFLRRLHLKTIISLTPEPQPNLDLREFCQNEDISIRHFYVEKFQGGLYIGIRATRLTIGAKGLKVYAAISQVMEVVTLTNAKVIQILELIICPENLPLYLHCLDGARVTGLVVMCFRKLQCWNLSTSTAEFCRFQREGEISREESQFVETFRGDFNVPAVIPNWLWQGIRTVKHPTFRLHLLPSPFQAEREGEAFTGVNGFLANSNASLQSSSNSSDGQGDCNKRHRMVCSKSEKGLHLLATNCTSVIAGKNILQSASTEDQDSKSKGMNYMKDEDLTNLQREEVHSSGVLLKKPDNQVTCRSKKNATFDSNPGIRNHQIECRKLEMEALSLEGLNLVRWKLQMPPLPKRPNLALCICNDGKVGYLQETNFSWSYLRNCLH